MIDQQRLHAQRLTPEQVRIQLVQQYYSYLRLVKTTRNFLLDPEIYKTGLIDFSQFNEITIIGTLQEIKVEPLIGETNSMQAHRQADRQVSCLIGIIQTMLSEEQINNLSQWERKQKKRIQHLKDQEEKERAIRKEKRRAERQHDIKRRREQEWMRQGLTEEQKEIKRKQLLQSQSQTQPYPNTNNNNKMLTAKKTKTKQSGVMRQMLIPMPVYKAYLYAFNKIMQAKSIKNGKSQLHAFTHLTPRIINQQIIFTCTSNTTIMQLERNLIERIIEPMERSLLFTYSRIEIDHHHVTTTNATTNNSPATIRKYETTIPLTPIVKEDTPTKELTKEISQVMLSPRKQAASNGLPYGRAPILNDLKIRLAQVRRICIMGIIKSITICPDIFNKRDKEIEVELMEDCPHGSPWEIGICKIVIRYPLADEQNLMRCMQVNRIHLFIDPQIYLSDSVIILYKMRIWHKHILKVSSKEYNTSEIYNKLITVLKPSPISLLYAPHIFRNVIKIRATFEWFKMMHAKVTCQRCNQILSSIDSQPQCINGCRNITGRLYVWTIIGASDQHGVAELSLEDNLFFRFFNIEEIMDEFKVEVMKEDGRRKGVTLYHSASGKSGEYATEKIIRNNYFQRILSTVLHCYRQMDVVGVPKYDMNQNFNALSQDKKQQFLSCYVKASHYMRNQKVNLNGYIQTNKKGELKYVPLIKVSHIIGS